MSLGVGIYVGPPILCNTHTIDFKRTSPSCPTPLHEFNQALPSSSVELASRVTRTGVCATVDTKSKYLIPWE